eukprot:7191247-Prymnesium_polylepis.1
MVRGSECFVCNGRGLDEATPTEAAPPAPWEPGISSAPIGSPSRAESLEIRYQREYLPAGEEVQRRVAVAALSLLAHRVLGAHGRASLRAAEQTFRPDDFDVYLLACWREGDAPGGLWGELAASVASAMEEEPDASATSPAGADGDPGAPPWWMRATARARSMLGRLMPNRPIAEGGAVSPRDPDLPRQDLDDTDMAWRELAKLAGHAFQLQWIFLRTSRFWRRDAFPPRFMWVRPGRESRCGMGANLASEAEFQEQAHRASECLAFYELYVAVWRRLAGGADVLDCCCGGGGQSEGVARMGGVPFGIDRELSSSYQQRFGEHRFSRASILESGVIEKAMSDLRWLLGVMAGPSCKGSSTASFAGKPSSEPVIIDELRDRLVETGRFFSIEQPLGSSKWMRSPTILRGSMFGLHVDRPRMFETNFALH